MKNLEKISKIECLHPCFTFAGFAGFADLERKVNLPIAGGKGNYRQNSMY